ncbi:MAG: enoyl-CoA hydratase [Chloroflexi bacterium]|jgi:enoyl-CoA hydratase|nr:enoyl-CoA hydratase [Chloroflexota bacterium]
MPDTEYVIVGREDTVAVLTLNRPEALNALSPAMLAALCDALESLDADEAVRAIIIDGGQRAFAAGADIQAMAQSTPMDIVRTGTLSYWQRIRRVNKPLIAAVSGYAYGGGCELAMLCDLIVASETARFAQPEIKLGIMPGAGGTQRLARAIGFYRAMEMILTGEPISARQAYEAGLVNRVVPPERYLDEALELARLIASRPPVAVRLAREALRYGYESTLRDGLEIERRNFTLLFDTQDQKEGMRAFLEKRSPDFSGR